MSSDLMRKPQAHSKSTYLHTRANPIINHCLHTHTPTTISSMQHRDTLRMEELDLAATNLVRDLALPRKEHPEN